MPTWWIVAVMAAGWQPHLDQRQPDPCTIEIRLVAELGRLEDPFSVTQPFAVQVERIPAGGWVVVDAEVGGGVFRYAPDGSFAGRLVPRGEGPEEIVSPARVTRDPTDSLWITPVQGRAVIVGRDGSLARTLVNPTLLAVDGHTPSGLPFSLRNRLFEDPSAGLREQQGLVRVWSREGDSLHVAGPAAFMPSPGGREAEMNISIHSRMASLDDTTFLSWAQQDRDVWIERWTPHRSDVVLTAEEARDAVGLDGVPPGDPQGRAVSVAVDDAGATWVLGVFRQLSAEQATRLLSQALEALGRDPDSFAGPEIRYLPSIADRMFRGRLFRLDPDGEIQSVPLDGYPRNCVDARTFLTLAETDMGLLQVRVWEFAFVAGRR